MPLLVLKSRKAWAPALVLLGVLSFLPQRYCGYASPLSDVVRHLVSPLSAPLNSAVVSIQQAAAPEPLGNLQALSELIRQQDNYRMAQDKLIRQLKDQITALQGLRRSVGTQDILVQGRIVGRSTGPEAGMLTVNVGSRDGVGVGHAVTDHQVNLVGRVVDVGRSTCVVQPINMAGMKIEVVMTPKVLASGGTAMDQLSTCLLEPHGSRELIDDRLARTFPVEIGHYARLMDEGGPHAWPAAVQGMIVGEVVDVILNADDPLRKTVKVRPLNPLYTLDTVTVIVPGVYQAQDRKTSSEVAP